jgi:hypothetical protein
VTRCPTRAHRPLRHRLRRAGEQRLLADRRDQASAHRLGFEPEIERRLPVVGQQITRSLKQDSQLSLGMGRAHMRHDPLPPATDVLSDLHRRRTRRRPHPPNERHQSESRAPISA